MISHLAKCEILVALKERVFSPLCLGASVVAIVQNQGCFIRWFAVWHADESRFWSAVAERSGDAALASEQSAVAATLCRRTP